MLRHPDVISTVNRQRSVGWEGCKVVYSETSAETELLQLWPTQMLLWKCFLRLH